jgi:DMSO/TMAO reductase YedYZ molybdopterin-dependent catalytic subunit
LKKRFLQIILPAITTVLILFNCLTPAFAQLEWILEVGGAVNNNFNLTLDQLSTMPPTSVQADIYCGASYVTGGNWTGVALSYILEQAGVNSQAESVGFTATDGYSVKITLATAMRDDVIIAYRLDGQPLSEGLRLVIPGANGADWIAKINQIAVLATADPDAEPFKESNPNGPTSATPAPTQTTPAKTITPAPTTNPSSNQTGIQPAATSTESHPQSQEDSSETSVGEQYAFPLGLAAITAVAATAVTGYLIRKRRLKNPETQL